MLDHREISFNNFRTDIDKKFVDFDGAMKKPFWLLEEMTIDFYCGIKGRLSLLANAPIIRLLLRRLPGHLIK
jgi:hypothetical protein